MTDAAAQEVDRESVLYSPTGLCWTSASCQDDDSVPVYIGRGKGVLSALAKVWFGPGGLLGIFDDVKGKVRLEGYWMKPYSIVESKRTRQEVAPGRHVLH